MAKKEKSFRVSPEDERNPFSALVQGEYGRFDSGFIRIEPPCSIANQFLAYLADASAVRVSGRVNTSESTLLYFMLDGTGEQTEKWSDDTRKEMVREATAYILDFLGASHSEELFREFRDDPNFIE